MQGLHERIARLESTSFRMDDDSSSSSDDFVRHPDNTPRRLEDSSSLSGSSESGPSPPGAHVQDPADPVTAWYAIGNERVSGPSTELTSAYNFQEESYYHIWPENQGKHIYIYDMNGDAQEVKTADQTNGLRVRFVGLKGYDGVIFDRPTDNYRYEIRISEGWLVSPASSNNNWGRELAT